MRKIFIWIVTLTVSITVFLIYNHKQPPIEEDVFKFTEKWSSATEDVYLVRKIDGDWLTIFRNWDSIMMARLEQNWLGNWELRNDEGLESTLISTYFPPIEDDEFTWSASGSKERNRSYYFGQIINPIIKRIEVETKKGFFEDALIVNSVGAQFFFVNSDYEMLMPVNIRALSETGELIYSTIKPIKNGELNSTH